MNEKDLLELWFRARLHLIISQLAPTFLLTVTVIVLSLGGGAFGSLPAKIATVGVLLASGILGFVAQFSAAAEARAVANDLRAVESPRAVTTRIIALSPWTAVPKFVTPAIFVVIFVAIAVALFLPAPIY